VPQRRSVNQSGHSAGRSPYSNNRGPQKNDNQGGRRRRNQGGRSNNGGSNQNSSAPRLMLEGEVLQQYDAE
jgi:hypothetical protein